MPEDLFGTSKELSRADKMRASRKATTDLTRKVIDWLNETQQFHVHRSNNFPSPRITRNKAEFKYIDSNNEQQIFEYDEVEIHFKKGNIKESILDISGIVLPYNMNDSIAGHVIELEVKTGKDSLSEGQINRINVIKKAGGISFVFSDWHTFMIQITPYLVERKLAF